ncbi:MAG: hypothetical protein FWE57_09625 [Chitinispirillia bacterium]|nr:hypothetical protein [Chitinispirillia bacterium]
MLAQYDRKKIIRFDWALKRLLRNKADHTVLEGFLSVLLHEDELMTNWNLLQAGEEVKKIEPLKR